MSSSDDSQSEIETSSDEISEKKHEVAMLLSQMNAEDRLETIEEAMGPGAAVIAQSMSYSGPVPPADELRNYEIIQPGFADRLIKLAENEQSHRHKSSTKYLHNDRIRISGSIFVSLTLIGSAIVALFLGQPLTAIILGGIPIVSQVLKLVLEWLPESSESESKKD